ncbi:MAG: sensor histidine kinase [Cytophagales bacterium]|nr:sensor histidine kinase [Cytophagales bacterium]
MHNTISVGLIIIYAFFAFEARSQNQSKADSIRVIIESQKLSLNEEMEAYYWLSTYSSSPEEELEYGKELLELAGQSNSKEYRIKSNLRIGIAHRLMGNLSLALASLFESANDALGVKEFEHLLTDVYLEISSCYTQNGDSDNALLYGAKTVDFLRTIGNKERLGPSLLNIGYDYYLIGNYDSAMAYYNESEPILQEVGMTLGLAYLIGNRALVYWKKGKPQKAQEDLFIAIDMLKKFDDRYAMADYYNQLGNIFLEENKQQKALDYTIKGLEMAESEGMKEQIRDASYLLFVLYQKVGDYKTAIAYQAQHNAYKDSIQNIETTQKLANLRTRFEVGQKQAEVDLLLEQKRNNQIVMITGVIILFIVMGLSILIYSYSKSKIKLSKQLEERKDALVASNNSKDKFFSIISHDLRAPVGNLSGLMSVTKCLRDEGKSDQMAEALDKMENSVDRLVKLLDNLLRWALQQRGHFPYAPESLSIKDVLSEATDMFADIAEAKKIDLELHVKEEFNVFIDKNTTSTIFRNLLNNAIKFTPIGGQVCVLAKKDLENKTAKIEFIDNGVGIPNDKLKILSDLNSTISTRGTSGETGHGLGLQLVYDFIELNKGEIEVVSEEGKGTSFIVWLPLS